VRRWLLLALAAAACGDNWALPRSHELVVVAHEDDDLLFMQPDLAGAVRRHEATTITYVTAGDAGAGLDYATSRVVAAKAAYGWVAGSQDWHCDWVPLAGHAAQRCELAAANLSLVFLGYPDGGIAGDGPNSLLRLWRGEIERADTVAERVASYDRAGLVDAVAEVVALVQPSVIRTLELSACHGYDHSDHMMVGALALLAAARGRSGAQIVSYRGYNVNNEAPNNPEAFHRTDSLGMRAYEACQVGCASCVSEVCDALPLPWYDEFLYRHYSVATRRTPMSGLLQTQGGCAVIDGDRVALGDCARGTELRFEHGGGIRAGDRCLRVAADRQLVAGSCDGGPERYFLLDDEGHLWSGMAPELGAATAGEHAMCLVGDASGVRAEVCGAARNARWTLGRPTVSTLWAQLGVAARGRAVQLADVTGDGLADLCRIERDGLWCAVGDGHGGFGNSLRIDAVGKPIEVEPASLSLGDIDGDGEIDACGRSPLGTVCALAAHGYVAALWSPAFADDSTSAATGLGPLAIVDGQVCGAIAGGVACAAQGAPAELRASLSGNQPLWPADLDGDGVADWCTETSAGPVCGLDVDRAVTSAGGPWGFAFHVVEGSVDSDGAVADQLHGAVADVSGDGRGDLCVTVAGGVECAASQGHGFGPRFPVLGLAPNSTAAALWLGDLDGDGKADACVDTGAAIACAPSP
jgi:LmbE family N-acetylglucosaminyl deacetylase